MASEKDIEIQGAYRDWLKNRLPERAVAVTLTFNPSASGQAPNEARARDAVRVLSRMLHTKAYGKRFHEKGQLLTLIPVREGGTSHHEKRVHYHLIIGVPDGWQTDDWMAAIVDRVRRIRSFSNRELRVRSIWDDGWLEYILKLQDKSDFGDAVDVANLSLAST